MEKWYKEILPMQVTRLCSPRPMPSSFRSKSRSRLIMMKFLLKKGTINLRKKKNSLERLQKEPVQLDVGGHKFKTTEETLTIKTVKINNIEICKRAYIFLGSEPKTFWPNPTFLSK